MDCWRIQKPGRLPHQSKNPIIHKSDSSFASLQQPAGFFCKETRPGQHRREALHLGRIRGESQRQLAAKRLGSAFPINPPIHQSNNPFPCQESKPQQTGTGFLTRHGEVATTSGSTISSAEWRVRSAESGSEAASMRRLHSALFTLHSAFDCRVV